VRRLASTRPALAATRLRVETLVAALVLAGCGSDGSSPCGPTKATVTRVVDGDTIELSGGEKVRYILVNANEITNGHNECYGAEASAFNASLVEGKDVTLAYDTECRDRFGRLLAYVSVDGREVNRLLVERGYACVLYIPPDGMARHQEFETLEAQAMADSRGMWGICTDGVPCASK
jgi:micrococcal nuclease